MSKTNSNTNGFPEPLKAHCFKCQNNLLVKFVVPRFTYSKKNDWYHWTDKAENQGKYICDACLIHLYKKDRWTYLENITDLGRRRVLRTYIFNHTLKV